MALDAQEFQRRRQQRQHQRQKQQALQRKRLLLTAIGGAAAVVILVVVMILARPQPPAPPETQPATQDSTPSTAASEPQGNTVIHFAMGGDLNVTDNVVAAGGNEYNYTNAFLDVAHILADADISAVNFEGNLLGAPFGSATLSAPQSLIQALHSAGLDMVQLANSYSINAGIAGLNSTINSVRNAGMIPLGVYGSNAQFQQGGGFTIVNVQGIRIAFVAFTKGMDGMALPAGSEHCVNVLYTDYDSTYQKVDTQGITSVLQAAQRENPDVTIALLHWGSEFNNTISATQERIRNLMLDNGVDAIVGTHSHYVQKLEFDQENGTFVAYSLGDFFGDAAQAGSEYSIILDLEITKDNTTGKTSITGYDYTPIFTVTEEGSPSRVMRIKEAMAAYEAGFLKRVSKETYDDMAYALQRITARVAGE